MKGLLDRRREFLNKLRVRGKIELPSNRYRVLVIGPGLRRPRVLARLGQLPLSLGRAFSFSLGPAALSLDDGFELLEILDRFRPVSLGQGQLVDLVIRILFRLRFSLRRLSPGLFRLRFRRFRLLVS